MAALVAAVLGFVALGCSTYGYRPGQALAEHVVWVDLYGMSPDTCPEVEWVAGRDVFAHSDGFTWAGWKIQVADKDGAPIQVTAFAHELMHFRTYLLTGDVDAAHWRGDWDLADRAAPIALAEAGL